MEANELRIGNYVIYGGSEVEMNVNEFIHFVRFPETYEPIPLTEEWLGNFGFEDGNKYVNTINQFTKNKFGIMKCEWSEDDEVSFNLFRTPNGDLFYYKHGKVPIVKFVHQLQNLYFALTGDELTQVSEGKNKNFV